MNSMLYSNSTDKSFKLQMIHLGQINLSRKLSEFGEAASTSGIFSITKNFNSEAVRCWETEKPHGNMCKFSYCHSETRSHQTIEISSYCAKTI